MGCDWLTVSFKTFTSEYSYIIYKFSIEMIIFCIDLIDEIFQKEKVIFFATLSLSYSCSDESLLVSCSDESQAIQAASVFPKDGTLCIHIDGTKQLYVSNNPSFLKFSICSINTFFLMRFPRSTLKP